MTDIEKLRTESEARHTFAERRHTTRYGAAVNRYLGVIGYRSDEQSAPPVQPKAVTTKTGVVLVGVDDSPISYTAVDHAAIEADLRGWDLRILHVQRPRGDRDAGASLLQRLTDRVHACAPAVPVAARLIVGSAAPLLLVEGRKADLVVVGHRHGTAGTVFGVSVGDRVAADHTGVVLVVRVPGWPPGPGFGSRPIVVGVDGDDSPAVGFAHREARVRGCDLVLLHAGKAARSGSVDTVGGVRMHRRFVAGDPATALIEASDEAAALVIGRHGPAGVPAGILGSVSRSVIKHAYCPVFLV
ncbi:universal stress protein [Actinoplanes sp. TBRC 11911]|uniref:universal stress protein n=1 Tax=Actinoplanes sp. TBRC 11911 TaxID=2729386 RepID=UPI00145E894F|nr:universal stress protein [Actinoplanes sp. TBRC 11911]NMO57295.1 universal stress protein [Actinoplanes sp. TBRC 11911]